MCRWVISLPMRGWNQLKTLQKTVLSINYLDHNRLLLIACEIDNDTVHYDV